MRTATFISLLLPAALAVRGSAAAPEAPRAAAQSRERAAFVPGEIIVSLREGAGALDEQRVVGRARGRAIERIAVGDAKAHGRHEVLRIETTDDVLATAALLEEDPDVEYAEPNWRIWPAATSNDTDYLNGRLWGVYSDDQPQASGPTSTTNAFGTHAEQAWAAGRTGARTVYVGVLDEGVAFEHPDLDANVWTNPFDPPNGIDDDGNRFVDDVHGWDFNASNATVYDGGTTGSEDRHGTHVAGTIGAEGGNGAGIAGIAWNVTIIPAKILGATGGSTLAAARAIDYMVDLKTRHGLDIVALNNSWSSGGYSQSLHDAVIRAAKAGIVMVCAAGNDAANNDSVTVYPANFSSLQGTSTTSAATWDNVISVAAIDRYGALSSFSNYGVSKVDIGAPGSSIYSTLPPAGYGSYSGTSMATPHVAGAAALFKAANPGATGSEVRAAILGSAVATPSLQGKVATGGRLDVSAPSFAPAPVVAHDVAVTSIATTNPASTGRTYTVTVPVTNQGTASETFTVSVVDQPPTGGRAGSVSSARTVTLAAGASSTLSFSWNTTYASVGTHLLRATAGTVSGETDTADNVKTASASVVAAVTPMVTSISPPSTRRSTTIVVTVTGSNFLPGARVYFQYGAGPIPVAANVVVSPTGTSLTATVSVGAGTLYQTTHWDVVVSNTDNRSGRRVDAFAVIP